VARALPVLLWPHWLAALLDGHALPVAAGLAGRWSPP
tara:strand:- start:180 stop:290 length:111 start_codon:yes stop_codon:yes gene_type:complete